MKGKWYIYHTVNLINGHDYVGKRKHVETESPLTERYAGSGSLIKQAINKYGRENFKKEILDDLIDTDQDASIKEIIWIAYYKYNDKAYYNLCYDIDSKRIQKLFNSEEFKNFNYKLNNNLPFEDSYKSLINFVINMVGGPDLKGLESFYNGMTEDQHKTWGERISAGVKRYYQNIDPETRKEISLKMSKSQKDYFYNRESKEHKETKSRKSSLNLGKVWKLIGPDGNEFEVRGLSLWCRDTFGEKYESARSCLQMYKKYKGYKLIGLAENNEINEAKKDVFYKGKAGIFKLRNPEGKLIYIKNLNEWCSKIFDCSEKSPLYFALQLRNRKKYKGYEIIERLYELPEGITLE